MEKYSRIECMMIFQKCERQLLTIKIDVMHENTLRKYYIVDLDSTLHAYLSRLLYGICFQKIASHLPEL